jgi:hypothetical protein
VKALDFWLKVFGMFAIQTITYVCVKGEIKLPYDGVIILWFISCIFEIILFNKLLKRRDRDA